MGDENGADVEMKDLTSTSFGYIIAFLIPGLIGLYALGCWSGQVSQLIQPALRADATVGPSFILLLVALGAGLVISAVRFVVFEKVICRSHRFPQDMFAKLVEENKLPSFRAVVDEHYRYHQFYGGAAVAGAALYAGWVAQAPCACVRVWSWVTLFFTLSEILLVYAAWDAFIRYVERGNTIVNGN